MDSPIVIKLHTSPKEIRRFSVKANTTFADLKNQVKQYIPSSPEFSLRYVDDEGDMIFLE